MNKSQLLPLLKEASKYAPKKKRTGLTSVPILAYAKVNSNNGVLTIETTDLEKYFIGTIKSDLPDMEFLIDVRWFRDIINIMDKGEIEFELSDFTKIYLIESTVIGKEKHMTNYESIENHEYETDITDHKPITEKENHSSLVIRQGNSKFMFYINGKDEFELTEFPLSFDKTDLKYKIENINGKNFTGILYTYVAEDDYQDPYKIHKDRKKELNKLFPKYLKINGVIAVKRDLSYDLIPKNDNPNSYDYKYYANYDLCYGSNIQDDIRQIFVDQIKDYEVVGKKK